MTSGIRFGGTNNGWTSVLMLDWWHHRSHWLLELWTADTWSEPLTVIELFLTSDCEEQRTSVLPGSTSLGGATNKQVLPAESVINEEVKAEILRLEQWLSRLWSSERDSVRLLGLNQQRETKDSADPHTAGAPGDIRGQSFFGETTNLVLIKLQQACERVRRHHWP